jgi:rod shape-determining protein MreC
VARAARSGSRLDAVLLVVCLLVASIARGLPAERRAPFAAGLRRTLVAPLVSLQHRSELARTSMNSHEARMTQRDSVALRAMMVNALESENERLRKLLGLSRQLRWGFVPAEGLHGGGIGNEYTLTLTAGARAGVKPFSAIVAPEGLVGMVETVDPTMSLGILWSHPDFRVSAMAADGSAFGIVAAHLGDSASRYLMEMRGVPYRNSLAAGTLIVSSGLGSVYPRGIPIGTVLGEAKTPEQWARTYLVRPAVLPADVNAVMILMPQRSAAGVDNVWASVISDSAARRMAAAADSVVTADSIRTRAATARPDSIRRDSLRRVRRDSLARIRRDSIARAGRDTSQPRDTTPLPLPPA